MKMCKTCKLPKPAKQFNADSSHKDKLASECKLCKNARRKRWVEAHRNDPKRLMYARRYNRQWRVKNLKKRRAQGRATYYRRRKNGYVHRYNPYRDRARRVLSVAIKKGLVRRPKKCSECGWKGRVHGHHEDYNKPLEVVWLCQVCHGKRHRSPDIPT